MTGTIYAERVEAREMPTLVPDLAQQGLTVFARPQGSAGLRPRSDLRADLLPQPRPLHGHRPLRAAHGALQGEADDRHGRHPRHDPLLPPALPLRQGHAPGDLPGVRGLGPEGRGEIWEGFSPSPVT